MIISGGSRSNWRFFSKHLMKAEDNERVHVAEVRGLVASDVLGALREMDAVASATRCKNFFYHANINPREGETLTPEQWEQATDTLERNLGLTGHARFAVEHEKDGRIHRHIVWSRIDADTMRAVSDSFTAPIHERTSRELEQAFGLEPVESVLTKDRETQRPERRPKNWETFRGYRSAIDPKEVKAEVTALWNASDSGEAFAAALEEHSYILCKGDRRDFCIVDSGGDEHSLARRISGAKAADIRARMGTIDRDTLPSVEEGRQIAQQRMQQAQEPDEPQPALSALETFAAQTEEVMRQEGEPRQDAPDISLTDPPPISALDAYAATVETAMREDGGELDLKDGLTWWERTVTVLAEFRDRVVTWVRDRWQEFVANREENGNNGRDDPDAGEDTGPDMGR